MLLLLTPRKGWNPQTAGCVACAPELSNEQHRRVAHIPMYVDSPITGAAWQEYTTSARAGAAAR
jgi:hypothetical protein